MWGTATTTTTTVRGTATTRGICAVWYDWQEQKPVWFVYFSLCKYQISYNWRPFWSFAFKMEKTRWSFAFGCYATVTRCQMPALYSVGHQTVANCRLGAEGRACESKRERQRESNVWADVGARRSREGAACWECARWSATCSQHDFLSPAHGPEASLANKTRGDSRRKVREWRN